MFIVVLYCSALNIFGRIPTMASFGLQVIRLALSGVAKVSPEAAGRAAFRIFATTPGRKPRTAKERELFARSEGWMQRGEESVGPRKLGRLVRAGRRYVETRGWTGPWRIDILAVTLHPGRDASVERFEDVTAGAYLT